MRELLTLILLVPLGVTVLAVLFGRNRERFVSVLSLSSAVALGLMYLALLFKWVEAGCVPVEVDFGTLYAHDDYRFPIVLYFDHVSAVFLEIIGFISLTIVRYSQYYLHREAGYARFFATIFLFIFGMNLLILSGTIDMLFAGWEAVGLSSFLLIGFYRERAQPVRNALRTFSVYRLCDAGLLLGAWLSHLIWHQSQHFSTLRSATGIAMLQSLGPVEMLGLSLLILLAAAGKSAQFPFCFWLPRAMEGPTPSSAIFYGALSIHAGIFLLIRTYPIWHSVPLAVVAVGGIGFLSAVVATMIGRTQSNIKGQIAYASICQVGLMLIELAFELRGIALVHFVGNACLRSYQLLISPSVVSHLLRVQASAQERIKISDWSVERRIPDRLRTAFYVFALNEGYLEAFLRAVVWVPANAIGRLTQRLDITPVRFLSLGVMAGLLGFKFANPELDSIWLLAPGVGLMLAGSLSAVAERKSFLRAWNAIGFSSAVTGICVLLHSVESSQDVLVYLSGAFPAWVFGTMALRALTPRGETLDVRRFHGLIFSRTLPSYVLFACLLCMVGFPLVPTFMGEDLILHHAVGAGFWVGAAVTFTFLLNGLSAARIYCRICLGPQWAAQNVLVSTSDETSPVRSDVFNLGA